MNNNFNYNDYENNNKDNKVLEKKDYYINNLSNKNESNSKNIIISLILIIAIIGLVSSIVIVKFNKEGDSNNSNNNNNNQVENNKDKEDSEEEKEVTIIDINSNTRPYAVMINCHNGALPQAGLNHAYIVYELMVEGGITRMMALFKDREVAKIGSVRSARTQYLDYVYEHDAIYVHAGGAKDALNRISGEKINHIDVDGVYGFRDTTLKRSWEHTLFTSTEKLKTGVTNHGYKTTTNTKNLLTYQADSLDLNSYKSIKTANNVSIKYSDYRTSNYTYDSNKKVYLRSMNNTQNIDLVTNLQYEVKNIIVYGVNYSTYTYNNYNGYQKLANVGSGDGYYITEGKAIPITWSKPSKNEKTIYKVKETGKELIVNDGNTYIQIYPTSGSLSIN